MRRLKVIASVFVASIALVLAGVEVALATGDRAPRIDKVLFHAGMFEILGANFGSSPAVTLAGEPLQVLQAEPERILVTRPGEQLAAGTYALRVQVQPPHPALAPFFRALAELTLDSESTILRVDRLEAGELSAGTASIGPGPVGAAALTVFGPVVAHDDVRAERNLAIAGSVNVGQSMVAALDVFAGQNVSAQSNLTVGRNATVNGNVAAAGTLAVIGATTLHHNLAVNGAATLQSNLSVVGAANLASTLTVRGATRLNSTLAVAGDLTVGGVILGQLASPSDTRLKRDIAPLAGGLDMLRALRGVRFAWRDAAAGEGSAVGVIAQEIEAVVPEAVRTSTNGSKAVYPTSLAAVIIEAVKEQQATIERQRAEIEALAARFAALEAVVAALNR